MELTEENPFSDLPEALVSEMLSRCPEIGANLFKSFRQLRDNISVNRQTLRDNNLLKKDADLSFILANPTSCGIDGSYAIERLLSTDLVAIAGVAVEGLTPPSEVKYWPQPHHLCRILALPHYASTSLILRATMMCMELELATLAPHDIVMLDGSLTTPLIHLNQALYKINEIDPKLSSLLYKRLEKSLESYKEILHSQRSDKTYVGLPKYTTRREVSHILKINNSEDRSLLSFILESGEFVGPIKMQADNWEFRNVPTELHVQANDIVNALSDLHIVYYKPFQHLPVLRLEIAKSIANNKQRLAVLFESLRIQCAAPSIFEPYPLYLADRMVKHLHKALPAIRKTATQDISMKWSGSLGEVYLAMHGYRTELGNY